MQSQIHVNMTL